MSLKDLNKTSKNLKFTHTRIKKPFNSVTLPQLLNQRQNKSKVL